MNCAQNKIFVFYIQLVYNVRFFTCYLRKIQRIIITARYRFTWEKLFHEIHGVVNNFYYLEYNYFHIMLCISILFFSVKGVYYFY